MKKPWTIASTSEIVTEGLQRRCDGTHEHEEARGKDCKLAEDYTDEFARQVHIVLARACAHDEFACESSPHPPCAVAVLTSQSDRGRPRPPPPQYRPLPPCGGCSSACGGACAAAAPSLALPTSETPSLATSQTLVMEKVDWIPGQGAAAAQLSADPGSSSEVDMFGDAQDLSVAPREPSASAKAAALNLRWGLRPTPQAAAAADVEFSGAAAAQSSARPLADSPYPYGKRPLESESSAWESSGEDLFGDPKDLGVDGIQTSASKLLEEKYARIKEISPVHLTRMGK